MLSLEGVTFFKRPSAVCRRLPLLLACLVLRSIHADEGDPLWPAYRHDARRAGISPLQGGLATPPRVQWKIDLGGVMEPWKTAYDLDVDGDGSIETVLVGPNDLVCRAANGEERWRVEGLTGARWIERADLNGNGRLALIFETDNYRERSIQFIDGPTGSRHTLFPWHSAFGYRLGSGPVIPNDASRSGQKQFYALWDGWNPSGPGQIMHFYLFGSDRATGAPRLIRHVSEEGNIFGAQFLTADADGDGADDLIFVSMEQAWVYDLHAGSRKMYYHWGQGIRTYSAYVAARRLQDNLILTMINPHLPGLESVALEKDGSTRLLWKQVAGDTEDQYQQTLKLAPACSDPLVDLDADGRFEILTRITNEHGDQKSYLVVFDSQTGRRLSQSEEGVITIDNLDGAGPPEAILERDAELEVARWNGHGFVPLWKEAGAEPVLNPDAPADFSRAAPGGIPRRNPTVKRSGVRFLMKFNGQTWACALSPRGLDKIEKVRDFPTDSDHEPVGRVAVRRRVYMPPPALAGRLAGQVEIILRDWSGALVGFDGKGNRRRVWMTQSPSHPHNYENDFSQAEICDVDGDGSNDLITTTAAGTERAGRIVVLNAAGREQLSISPVADASEVCFGATGRMSQPAQRWIMAAYRRTNGNPVEVAYDGRSGAELWRRERYGGKGDLVRFGYPCATWDYDGNGSDEMVVSAGNYYGVLDVEQNRDLVGPVTLGPSHLPGHWSTRFRTILVPMKGRPPDVFLNRNNGVSAALTLNGDYRWLYSLLPRDNMPFNQEGIADLDGDGNFEVVTAHRDGTLRAFSNAAGDAKCPTCRADAPLTEYNHAGQIRWTFKVPGPINPSVYRSD
jgi:hypothetical protein